MNEQLIIPEQDLTVERVPITDLILNQRNPRHHSDTQVGAIVDSMKRFGFTNPVLVIKDTKEVVAGHGRIEASRRLGELDVPVIFLNMSREDALAYLIADNHIVDMGRWDNVNMTSILEELHATGYDLSHTSLDPADYEFIVQKAEEVANALPEVTEADVEEEVTRRYDEFDVGNSTDKRVLEQVGGNSNPNWWKEEETEKKMETRLEERLQEHLDTERAPVMNHETVFKVGNILELPELRADRIPDRLPSSIATYTEYPDTAHLYQDPNTAIFYIHGFKEPDTDNRRRTIYSFNNYDDTFDDCFDIPDEFLQKQVLAKHWGFMCEPDFSIWFDDPYPIKLFYVYKKRWVGRYWQEHGLQVIPHLGWSQVKDLDYVLEGVAPNKPVVINLQNMDDETDRYVTMKGYEVVKQRLNPPQVILYGEAKLMPDTIAAWGNTEVIGLPTRALLIRMFYWREGKEIQKNSIRDEADRNRKGAVKKALKGKRGLLQKNKLKLQKPVLVSGELKEPVGKLHAPKKVKMPPRPKIG